MNEYVIVPKTLLNKLEEDRVNLYNLLENMQNNRDDSVFSQYTELAAMMACTKTMYELANRNWEGVVDRSADIPKGRETGDYINTDLKP